MSYSKKISEFLPLSFIGLAFLLFAFLPLEAIADKHKVKVVHQRAEYRHVPHRGAHFYYRTSSRGYVVVRKPTTIYLEETASNVDTPFQEPVSQIIILKNENGSETPVRLESENGKWKGPNNELYDQLPTVEQLKPVYGL